MPYGIHVRRRPATLLFLCLGLLVSCAARSAQPSPLVTVPAVTGSAAATATIAPSPSPTAPPSAAPTGPAAYCRVADELTAVLDYDRHALTVLDPTYTLPLTYEPPDLVSALTGEAATKGERIRRIAYADLSALRAAAASAGLPLAVASAYRSFAEQASTFDHWVAVGGYEQALRTSARAGHSEHQLGTAVDLGDGSKPPWEYPDWGATPAGSWLAANAASFGFVISYPKDRADVTCYVYEPWHLRWVGREMAAKVLASGLTLHEYQTAAR